MRCQSHIHGLSYKPFYDVAPCVECSNPTNRQGDVLCADCSKGFNECSHCRTPLESQADKRILAAFRSPEAVSIRDTRKLARRNFAIKRDAVDADRALDCAASAAQLEKQLRPHRLACAKACQPYREKLDALSEDIAAEQQGTQLNAVQMASVSEQLRLAHEKCDKQCEPHLEKYERATRELIAAHNKRVAPYLQTAKRRKFSLQAELDAELNRLEGEMCTLLYRSTRVRFIVYKKVRLFWQGLR